MGCLLTPCNCQTTRMPSSTNRCAPCAALLFQCRLLQEPVRPQLDPAVISHWLALVHEGVPV